MDIVFFTSIYPLHRVKVQAFSNASGSPVDEKMLLQVSFNPITSGLTCMYWAQYNSTDN